MFKIEKNISIEDFKRPETCARVSKYPFSMMKVGDSFAIPDNGERHQCGVVKVMAAAAQAAKSFRGCKFKFRKKLNAKTGLYDIRCWRVA